MKISGTLLHLNMKHLLLDSALRYLPMVNSKDDMADKNPSLGVLMDREVEASSIYYFCKPSGILGWLKFCSKFCDFWLFCPLGHTYNWYAPLTIPGGGVLPLMSVRVC